MREVALGILERYRRWISPLLGTRCRFEPSCSRYASEALARHGLLAGSLLALARLLRCHPWCEGGWDPVPEEPLRWSWRHRGG